MEQDIRDYLDRNFNTLYERHDALKDSLAAVQLQLTSKMAKQEEQLSRHEREIEVFRQRGWQLMLASVTGAVSLFWHALNTMLGGKH